MQQFISNLRRDFACVTPVYKTWKPFCFLIIPPARRTESKQVKSRDNHNNSTEESAAAAGQEKQQQQQGARLAPYKAGKSKWQKQKKKTRRKIHRTQRYFGAHEVSTTTSLLVALRRALYLVLIHKRSLFLRTGLYSQYREVPSVPITKKCTLTSWLTDAYTKPSILKVESVLRHQMQLDLSTDWPLH